MKWFRLLATIGSFSALHISDQHPGGDALQLHAQPRANQALNHFIQFAYRSSLDNMHLVTCV